jgi:hypothetical protein
MKHSLKIFTLLFASTAFLLSISSCGGDDGPSEPVVYAVTLSTDNITTITPGESVIFHLVDNNNRDLTTDSNVTYKSNGTAISSNTFSNSTIGSYDITATYNDIVSNTITVRILTTAYTQKALIEDYTGAWCQYCPRIAYSIEQVEAATDNAIPVAVHNGDTMEYEYEGTLRGYFGVTGFPTGKINRTIDWTYPENNNIQQVTDLASGRSDVGLSIASTRTASNLSIDVSAKFSLTHTEPLKLVVYLLEDGLHETQINSTSFYGGGTIVNMEHNHVLRKTYTALLGNAIPSTDTEMNDTYSTNFSVTLPSSSTSTASDKLHIVAFIVNGNTKTVLNAQSATVGTTQDFD